MFGTCQMLCGTSFLKNREWMLSITILKNTWHHQRDRRVSVQILPKMFPYSEFISTLITKDDTNEHQIINSENHWRKISDTNRAADDAISLQDHGRGYSAFDWVRVQTSHHHQVVLSTHTKRGCNENHADYRTEIFQHQLVGNVVWHVQRFVRTFVRCLARGTQRHSPNTHWTKGVVHQEGNRCAHDGVGMTQVPSE